ncbi:hypothetical protein ACLMJK_001553 [Lecanora helva]
MASYNNNASHRGEAAPPYAHHAQYRARAAGSPQFSASTVTASSSVVPNQTPYQYNGPPDPRYTSNNAPHYYPSHNFPRQQQVQQKVHAVEIPQSSPSFSTTNQRIGVNRQPQLSQAAVVQTPSSEKHGQHTNHHQQRPQKQAPVDYQVLLLSLSEEYFSAAYKHGAGMASSAPGTSDREYYKLIATGLGCLEAVLGRFKLLPEREAIVRLRYATVLFEETENTMLAEEALGKGVALCDRHRLFNLKYNMQHLLARIFFGKNPRVAFKFLDGVIKDVQAYQHIAWVYAFRFLQISLHLRLSTHQDVQSALNQLKQVAMVSNDLGDKPVLAVATIIEAMTYVREWTDEESIEQAQMALAGVRKLQFDSEIAKLHQLHVLTSIVDLCCSLHCFDPAQASAKVQAMQAAMKNVDSSRSWAADGSFVIPIKSERISSCNTQQGILRKEHDGSLALTFNWMSKDDAYCLGYFLSGIATAHRNTQDGHKSERMFEEGIKRMKFAIDDKAKAALPMSISCSTLKRRWHEEMMHNMRLHLAFTLCARRSWSAAMTEKDLIQAYRESMAASLQPVSESLQRLSVYLEAVICQSVGQVEQALSLYENDPCSLESCDKAHRPSRLHRDVALLSSLNSLLILCNPAHPKHDQFAPILSRIEQLCLHNPNRQIQSALYLITATTPASPTIVHTKQALQSALQTAKPTDNNQLMCMLLNLLSWRFFRGVVGEQSEKSAMTSQSQAQKCMDSLWISVSAGVLSDTLEAAGKTEEAKQVRENGEAAAATLPEALQVAMDTES